MADEEEPLEERVRRALRIEQVVSEVSELKGQLQRIGTRLATLRAELVALGADPAVVMTGADTAPVRATGVTVPLSPLGAGSIEIADADVGPERSPDDLDLVPFDAVWDTDEH